MNKDNKHFRSEVSEQVRDKLLAIANEVENEVFSMVEGYGNLRIEPISGNSYDGFISFQNGGYEVSEFISTGLSSGVFVTDNERDWYESLQAQCEKDFRLDNKIEEDAELTDTNLDALSEYEQSYFDDQISMLRFETWIEQDNETVILRLSLGYKDAPYYRSKHDETIKEVTISVNELLEKDVSSLVKPFEDCL